MIRTMDRLSIGKRGRSFRRRFALGILASALSPLHAQIDVLVTDRLDQPALGGLSGHERGSVIPAGKHARAVEPYVATLGFFRQKSKSLVGLAKTIVAEHGGDVPRRLDELVKLPGVGRKTANVVLGNAYDINEGVVVDTHVQRLSRRLGLTRTNTPEKIEIELKSQM